jgi:maltooligosyltrehalose trehalohydrolase
MPMSEQQFGARLLSAQQSRFRLWAPSVDAVALEIEGRAALPMQAEAGGWFTGDADCGAGTHYRFRVAPDLAVPDPASHAQAADVHDWSVLVDQDAYRWQHPDWQGRPWHESVFYEVHVGACGGFAATMARLPGLAALGITAIELMPVADFPGAHNWGYDGVLPFAPDAAYGTPDALKALIDAAHGLGMMVFLDVVYNHFGPDGNYLGAYAAPFFREDLHTPWGAAIDFCVQEVRDFFTSNALYWLQTYRFDGLRFDAVHAISEGDWLREVAAAVRAATPPGRHIHLVLENDDNDAALLAGPAAGLYDAQWNDDGHHALHVLLTGEHEGYYAAYTAAPAEQLARCLSEGFIFQGQAPMRPGGALRGTPSGHLPPSAFVLFLQNHDQIGNRAFGERLTVLADPQALRAAQVLLLLSPAIPLLFMGEETGSREPFLFFTDHAEPALADKVREGRRKEFAHFAAFADAAERARIPDPNAPATFASSRPHLADRARNHDSVPASVAGSASDTLADTAAAPLRGSDHAQNSAPHPAPHPAPEDVPATETQAWITALLALRRTHIVPGVPGTRSLGARAIGAAAVCARWQLGDGRRLTIAFNLARAALPVTADIITFGADATLLIDTNDARNAVAAGTLPGCSALVFLEPSP